MRIDRISTLRTFEHKVYYDLVYEWEDVIAKELQLQFWYRNSLCSSKVKFLYDFLTRFKPYAFSYEMGPRVRTFLLNPKNIIPCIIDFYVPKEQIPRFVRSYKKAPIVLLSSKEAYDVVSQYLRENHIENFKMAHLPLSISDKYAIDPETHFKKKYDVVMMGKQNPLLHSYMKKYIERHPDMVYVSRKMIDGKYLYYTNDGEEVGDINTRDRYISLMRSARVALYNTHGMDGCDAMTKEYNQVTPRFLEILAAGCHVIARYVKNSDTDFYELEKFSPSVSSYEQFEELMDLYRRTEVDMRKYSEYLSCHYTSVRAKQLKEILNGI